MEGGKEGSWKGRMERRTDMKEKCSEREGGREREGISMFGSEGGRERERERDRERERERERQNHRKRD